MNLKNHPALLLGITILFVLALSYIPEGTSLLGYKTKMVDLFIDIKPDSLLYFNDNFNSEKSEEFAFGIAQNDLSFSFLNSPEYFNTLVVSPKDMPIEGNTAQLKHFFAAVKNAGTKKIRVGHFGDSYIEGDLITSDVRQMLQEKYGGTGPGLFSITSQDVAFRHTSKHSFSDNWKTVSVIAPNYDKLPLGINGFVSIPEGEAWVKYELIGNYKNIRSFNLVRIFYSDAKKSSIKISFDGGKESTHQLETGKGIKQLSIEAPAGTRSVKITATVAKQANFYGVSLEDKFGVYVDNIPWRGNTGISFRDISEDNLKDFDKLMEYKLMVLSFGGNMIGVENKDYNWYITQMSKVIENLKKIFPNTSFILTSCPDRGFKRGTKFMTDPSIPKLLEAQKKIAENTNIAFWNMWEAMGGQNAIIDWVEANPPLASKDYVHVNHDGSKKLGQMFATALLAQSSKF